MTRPATEFAVAVPVGEWTPRLGATLRSLARQDPRPAVALMDASGDPRVAALADRFDDLLVVRRHGPDAGQADAIASGWEALPGNVLGWLNADDYLAPDALARVAAALAAPGRDAVTGQSLILDEHGAPRSWHHAVAPVGPAIRRGCIVSQPSCFVRREAVSAAGGLDRARHYTMDWDLWLRLYDSGARFHHIDAPLSAVVWSRATKTGSFGPARRAEIMEIARRHGGPLAAAKTMVGFGIHHLAIYAAPPGAAAVGRALARGLGGPPAAVHGLYDDGRIAAEGGWLPVFHEAEQPLPGLAVRVAGEAEHVRLATPAGVVRGEADADGMVRLRAEIAPGAMCRLELDAPAMRLLGVAWLEPSPAPRAETIALGDARAKRDRDPHTSSV